MKKKKSVKTSDPQKVRFSLPSFRVLPLFILAGALMFGARVGSLWQTSTSLDEAVIKTAKEQMLIFPALAESQSHENAENHKDAEEGLGGEESVAQGKTSSLNSDISNAGFSQTEIHVLQQLAERREAIDQREQELDQRIAVLSAAEAQIDNKIRKLREIQTTIEKLMEQHDAQEKKKIDNLVKIYQSMKPKDAARIFEQMDMPILIRVISGMKQRSSAAILAKLTADRANAVTAVLATNTQLPADLVGEAGVKR